MTRSPRSFIVAEMKYPAEQGAIQFVVLHGTNKIVGFNHACPCGCGKWSFIRLDKESWSGDTRDIWERVGDDLHMTLTPSIGIPPMENGKWHWHGWLRNGVFEEG